MGEAGLVGCSPFRACQVFEGGLYRFPTDTVELIGTHRPILFDKPSCYGHCAACTFLVSGISKSLILCEGYLHLLALTITGLDLSARVGDAVSYLFWVYVCNAFYESCLILTFCSSLVSNGFLGSNTLSDLTCAHTVTVVA